MVAGGVNIKQAAQVHSFLVSSFLPFIPAPVSSSVFAHFLLVSNADFLF